MRLSRRALRATLGGVVVVAVIGAWLPAPAAAAALPSPDLVAGSDTGSSSTDNVTNDATPSFDISGVNEGDNIILRRDGTTVATSLNSAAGTVTLTDPGTALTDGVHEYTAARLLESVAGDISEPISVTIDTAAPSGTPGTPDLDAASDTASAANAAGTTTDNITKDDTPTFTVSGTVAEGEFIELLRGDAVAASGTSPLTDSAQADGTYTYKARFADTAGNTGAASSGLAVTIDKTAPATVAPDLAAASDTGRSNTDNITSTLVPDSAPALYATLLSFSFAREAGAAITWTRSINGGAAAAQTAIASGASTPVSGTSSTSVLATIPPTPGTYVFSATQTDLAGNTSAPGTLNVTMDVSPPAGAAVDLIDVSDTFPAAGEAMGLTKTDNITSSATAKCLPDDPATVPCLTFNVTTEANALVDLYRDGSQVGTQTLADGNGLAVIHDKSKFDGQTSNMHGYVAVTQDVAGNRNRAGNLPVYVDTENPGAANKLDLVDASDTGTDTHDDVTNDNTPTFTVTGAEDNALVELFRCPGAAACSAANRIGPLASRIGNGELTAPVTPDNSTQIIPPATAANTSWRFTTRQTDASGRVSSVMGVDVNVVIDTTPLAPPSPPEIYNYLFTLDPTIAVTKDVMLGFSVASGAGRVQLLRDGVVVDSRTAAGDLVDLGPLANGVYEYRTRSVDTAGNESALSDPRYVVVLNGTGYWLTGSDGGVFTFGNAPYLGSTGAMKLNAPVLGIEPTWSGYGYWLLARDGGVFTFGDADFFGSTGAMKLNSPILGMVATPSGNGYWLYAEDGGVFTFGDAPFLGSPAASKPAARIVDMAITPTGQGYWLVDAKGNVYSYGDASGVDDPEEELNAPIVAMDVTPWGDGLWLVAADGGVFTVGEAAYMGGLGDKKLNAPIIGMKALGAGDGYWLLAADGGVFAFGAARFMGSTGAMVLNKPIVGMGMF